MIAASFRVSPMVSFTPAPECLDAADVLARVLTAGIEGRGRDALQAGADADVESRKLKAVAEGSWRGKARGDIRSSGNVGRSAAAAGPRGVARDKGCFRSLGEGARPGRDG